MFYLFPLESIADLVNDANICSNESIFIYTTRKNLYLARFVSMCCLLLLTLLLTFGIAYPLLGILFLISVLCMTIAFQLSIHFHSIQISLLPVGCRGLWQAILLDELRDFHKILYPNCRN